MRALRQAPLRAVLAPLLQSGACGGRKRERAGTSAGRCQRRQPRGPIPRTGVGTARRREPRGARRRRPRRTRGAPRGHAWRPPVARAAAHRRGSAPREVLLEPPHDGTRSGGAAGGRAAKARQRRRRATRRRRGRGHGRAPRGGGGPARARRRQGRSGHRPRVRVPPLPRHRHTRRCPEPQPDGPPNGRAARRRRRRAARARSAARQARRGPLAPRGQRADRGGGRADGGQPRSVPGRRRAERDVWHPYRAQRGRELPGRKLRRVHARRHPGRTAGAAASLRRAQARRG